VSSSKGFARGVCPGERLDYTKGILAKLLAFERCGLRTGADGKVSLLPSCGAAAPGE